MSMKVTINALQYKRNSSGIGVLLRELFGRLGRELPCRVVLPKGCPPFPEHPGCELVYAPFSKEQGLRRVLFQAFALGPGYCKNAVVLTTDSKAPFVLPKSAKLISVITDLAVFRMSEVYQRSRALLWKLQYRYLCKRANGYIASSEFTKRELMDVLGIPADKIEVVPCAAPEGMGRVEDPGALKACRARYGLPRRFALFVGNLNPRKNLERLVRAFARMKATTGLPHELVIAGEQGWKFDRAKTLRDIGCADQVRFIGFVPDEDMAALYTLADVFAFPTLYEGFGIPVIEAQCCGTPVLTSNTSCLPEVCGDGAVYVDPYSEADIAEGLREILTDEALRRRLIDAGFRNANRYSWDASAARLGQIVKKHVTEGP